MNDYRYSEMLAMHDNGETLQQIGDYFGVSRQRVHQILGTLGDGVSCKRKIYRVIKENGEWVTQKQISAMMNYKTGTLSQQAANRLDELIKEGKVERRVSNMKYNAYVYRAVES